MKVFAQDITNQKESKFKTQQVDFAPRNNRRGFVSTIEIDPAKDLGDRLAPGVIRIIAQDNMRVHPDEEERRAKISGLIRGQINDGDGTQFFDPPNLVTLMIFQPPHGVVTKPYVKKVLKALWDHNAIDTEDLAKATQKLGMSRKELVSAHLMNDHSISGIEHYIQNYATVTSHKSHFNISGDSVAIGKLESALKDYNSEHGNSIGIKRVRNHLRISNPDTDLRNILKAVEHSHSAGI